MHVLAYWAHGKHVPILTLGKLEEVRWYIICRPGDCVHGALSWVAGALRLVIYEGQEAPAGGRSGGRRAAVAAADLVAADVVRAPLPLGACMLCVSTFRQGTQVWPCSRCYGSVCTKLLARSSMRATTSVCFAHAIGKKQAHSVRSHYVSCHRGAPQCSLIWQRLIQVLTTYDALRRDVHRGADGGEARTLRRRKRYQALPTPLTRLRWWRVCLDEVRMLWWLSISPRISPGTKCRLWHARLLCIPKEQALCVCLC